MNRAFVLQYGALYVFEIPFRVNYTRVLIVVAILFAILFPLVPSSVVRVIQIIRTVMGTYGMGISSIVAPIL